MVKEFIVTSLLDVWNFSHKTGKSWAQKYVKNKFLFTSVTAFKMKAGIISSWQEPSFIIESPVVQSIIGSRFVCVCWIMDVFGKKQNIPKAGITLEVSALP